MRARSLMDKILASEAEDYRFDSCRAHHNPKKAEWPFFIEKISKRGKLNSMNQRY